MPGIFGIISAQPRPREDMECNIEAMRRSMAHLPTYKSCTYVGDRVALGRIGPSFLNPEKQPVFSEDGKRMIVFEGELFDPSAPRQQLEHNGRKFREGCDAEVALHAFEQGGAQGIAKLAGAYVGCIYDSESHACHLFTDRLGLRGCYYCVTPDGTFLFASEMKAIAVLPCFSGSLDLQGAATLLNNGFPLFENSLFEQIKFVPSGSVLSFAGGRVIVEHYWDMPRVESPDGWRFEDAVDEGAKRLVEAVRRQFRQQGHIGAFLSGGLDSRAIVAAARLNGHLMPTFTLGAGNNTELKLASLAAKRMGVEHEALTISPDYLVDFGERGDWYTDGMLPCVQLPWLSQLPYVANRIQCLFSGYMGGVLLGGVFLKPMHESNPPVHVQGRLISEQLMGRFSPFLGMGLTPPFRHALEAAFHDASQEIIRRTGDRGFALELDRAYLATDERRATNIANGSLINVFMDVKYPFGDYDLLDFIARLPVRWRLGSRLYKAMLCRAFPELVDIPCISANTRFVPTRLNAEPSPWRLKQCRILRQLRFLAGRLSGGRLSLPDLNTYVHYDHWYRTRPTLRHWVASVLLHEQTLDRHYYDREGIKRLLSLEMSRGYLFPLLASMVTFEHWNRFFVDRDMYRRPGGAETPPGCTPSS